MWKNIWTLPFCSELNPGWWNDIENSITSQLGYRRFFKCLVKYTIWIYVEKYSIIAILSRISPRLMKWYWKFNPTLLIGLRHFFQKRFPRFLRAFFYIVRHISLNIEPVVRPSVRLSVRQSSEFAIFSVPRF